LVHKPIKDAAIPVPIPEKAYIAKKPYFLAILWQEKAPEIQKFG
jgi:hypothetical protein